MMAVVPLDDVWVTANFTETQLSRMKRNRREWCFRPLLFEMPIVSQLTTKVPAKYIMTFGWLCLEIGMYVSTTRLDPADQLWLR